MPTAESASRVLEIFAEAVENYRSDERDAFVRSACGVDDALRHQVQNLLAAHDQCAGFMARPVVASSEAPTAVFSSVVGNMVGPYKLRQQIGEGGMGVIYLAEQAEPVRRQVALKVIKPGMDSRQVIARFEVERQALSLMDHPHIARVLDVGTTEGGRPFFVMELVRGQPITKYCHEKRFTARQRLELLLPVCQAIQHAHQKGIIHRDLKPSNILVAEYDSKPVPKVIDFGIAKAIGSQLTDRTSVSGTGQFIGTLEYMSPEQARVIPLDVDSRSDIYSLGVVAYELLTGSTPFGRERVGSATWEELVRMIRDEEPPSPSSRLRQVRQSRSSDDTRRPAESLTRANRLPREIDWIVMKALDKDRSRRYESASEMASDIRRYLDDEPVSACPPSWRYRFGKLVRRHRALIGTLAIVMLTMLAGLIATTWQAYRATLAERQARENARQAVAERDLKDAALRDEQQQRAEANHQRQVAEQAANIAQAINRFLQRDLLAQADVGNQSGGDSGRDPDLRVRTLLDRASAQIDSSFEQLPHVEAAVRETLGRTYLALGLFDAAERHLERAADLFGTALGPDHRQTLSCASGLGSVYAAQGRHELARTLFETTLDRQIRLLGRDDSHTLTTKNALALTHHAQGKHAEASTLLQEVLAARTRTLGSEHRQTLICSSNLAGVYAAEGRYLEATAILESVLERRTRVLGRDHPDTLQGMNNLGRLYLNQQRFQEAERLLVEASESMQRLLGEDHVWTLTALDNLGQLRLVTGVTPDTVELFTKILRIRESKLGPRHADTLLSRNNLAQVHVARGELAPAIPILEETWALQRDTLGAAHAHTLTTHGNLGLAYFKSGARDKGVPILEQVFQLSRDTLGAQHPDTLLAQSRLAECYELTKGPEAAIPLWEQVVAYRSEALGPQAALSLKALNSLGVCYWRTGKFDQAVSRFEECLRARTEVLGPKHPDTLQTLANLGVTYKDSERPWEAIPLLERASQAATEYPQLNWITRQLADAYEISDQFDRAEALLRNNVEKLRQNPAIRPAALIQALADLATNLLRQGRFQTAGQTFREAIDVAESIQLNSPGKDYLMLQLGICLLAGDQGEEAEQWLLRGQEGFRTRQLPLPRPLVERIVELYEARGSDEQAQKWRSELPKQDPAKDDQVDTSR